jgi:hypothetical protein
MNVILPASTNGYCARLMPLLNQNKYTTAWSPSLAVYLQLLTSQFLKNVNLGSTPIQSFFLKKCKFFRRTRLWQDLKLPVGACFNNCGAKRNFGNNGTTSAAHLSERSDGFAWKEHKAVIESYIALFFPSMFPSIYNNINKMHRFNSAMSDCQLSASRHLCKQAGIYVPK